ncbi:hypothetical protein FOZ60_002164 [Perkinsus olseni]|uniref:Uncharacterized protein n=1 Tax=Perkinsus olseni TaxID=32597 RepID=A0A7J6NYQ8_PEROL|nr:hypothetical protein FOZ60_002164 [Perkinsus olseni]
MGKTWRPTGYAQIDDEEKVDLSRDRFPYCVVWTPLPVLSWLVPFIGHYEWIAHAELFYFGRHGLRSADEVHARCTRLRGEREGWDEAIQEGDSIFQQRLHNLFCNNCHHHVVECLNHLRYGGTRDWNQFSLCWLLLINGRNVSRRATSNVFTFAPPAYSDCVNCYSSLDGQYYIGRAVKGHDRGEVETVGMCVPKTCLQWEIKLLGKALDNITAVIDLREISPDCRSPSIAGEKRVAVCIEGPFGRADLNVLDSVRQNVVRPLNAKVLLVTDSEKGSNSTLDGVLEFDNPWTRFDDVVYTRIDLMWLAEHPPLEVLEAAVASPTVWVPDSEDWRGLNDRAAFMPEAIGGYLL